MLLHGSVIFLPASRALQFKNIRRPGHHRKSLAHAFLASRFRGTAIPACPEPAEQGCALFPLWEQNMWPATKLPPVPPRRPRHPVISNGAGRLFLPHSLLRMRRPAKREISLLFSLPVISNECEKSLFSCPSHLKTTYPDATIHPHGTDLPRLLHGQQVRRPLPRRDQQSFSPRRPAQRKNPSRLHAKIQRHQARLVRTSHQHPFGYLA